VNGTPWLVVVDMQNVFGDTDSSWVTPRFHEAARRIGRLVETHGRDRTVFTRFVAPAQPSGAWVEYYETFPFALRPSTDELYQITDSLAPLVEHTVEAHTFGKWTPQLAAITGPEPELLVCGVATDCCVLSTVLPAADAGASITVVTDACAGSSDENHQKALDVMALYQPLVSFATTEELVAAGLV
jgi:nicotinamidase-related amidase